MSGQYGVRVPLERIQNRAVLSNASPFELCDSEREHVRQSVVLILRTRPGTRPLLPGYGCRLHELLFRPNTPALRGQATFFVTEALRLWEPRIVVTAVTVEPTGDHSTDRYTLRVRVEYKFRSAPGLVEAVAVTFRDGLTALGPIPLASDGSIL